MEKLAWITVGYPINELKPGGGVVTQRDILQRFKADNPDEEVKKHAGFKCNQQDMTVSMRLGIINKDKANSNPVGVSPICLKETKLLQLGYDELESKLKHAEEQIVELKKGFDGRPCLCGACADNIGLQEKCDALIKENIRLISRLAEFDGGKYDVLVKENDQLKTELMAYMETEIADDENE